MKKILMIATTPFKNDGLTKIETDVINFNYGIIDFDIVTGFDTDNEIAEALIGKIGTIFKIPPKKKTLKYMAGIYRVVKNGSYDAVYIHGNSAMMLIEALPAKMAGARKIITHCHNTNSQTRAIHYLFKPLFNLIATNKLAVSSLAAQWAYNGKNVKVILNGIDSEKFKFDQEVRDRKRTELGWSDKFIIGHIGRFTEQKNHRKLVEVFAAFKENHPDARLLMVGDGELEDEIKEMVSEKNLSDSVCFYGTTNRPQDCMDVMDVMVMPSLYEGLCLVALEAQSNGLPLVTSPQFPPETFATDLMISVPLEAPANKWTEEIENVMGYERTPQDGEKFPKEKYSFENMMQQIQSILLEQ